MNDKTYEDGVLEGEIKSLQHDMSIVKSDVHELKLDTKSQSRLQNMFLGAIFLAQFVVPIVAKLWK